jgi:hypothetical protein
MTFSLEIKESAREDIAEIFLYYENRQALLSSKFLNKTDPATHCAKASREASFIIQSYATLSFNF